ncbi:hypothetical protein CEP54_015862 [Fusarium duplospermum]|uniref:Uncharacterized protein n=1 Tax=Fusarium duplospermum TaxID=1325734 RepID=A0A428NKT4_9HYPO|nr:hypothetical protein CEP54_015862 [Fusarium duplospermum]
MRIEPPAAYLHPAPRHVICVLAPPEIGYALGLRDIGAMDGRQQPPTGPEQGSASQSQHEVPHSASVPRDPRQEAFTRLRECIPLDEDQWREARERHGFATPDDIRAKVSAIIKDDPSLPADLRKFMHLAVCCVDRYRGDEAKYRKYRDRVHDEHLSELTIDRNMSVVQDIITLLDELYPSLQHRVFEIMLLYAPLKISLLKYFRQDKERFKSCFSTSKTMSEEQASFPLSPADLIVLRCPQQYTYELVHEALNVSGLPKSEYLMFVSALESKNPEPQILSAPHSSQHPTSSKKGRYDAVRDTWVGDDVDLTEYFNTEETFTIPDRITGYKVFDIPESIQQMANLAGDKQDGRSCQNLRDAVISRFDWSPYHSVVAERVYDELVQLGALSPEIAHGNQFFFRHDFGAMTTPNGWLCVIVPTTLTTERVTIALSYGDVQEDIEWRNGAGLLLGPGATLSTSSTIYYISMSFPID